MTGLLCTHTARGLNRWKKIEKITISPWICCTLYLNRPDMTSIQGTPSHSEGGQITKLLAIFMNIMLSGANQFQKLFYLVSNKNWWGSRKWKLKAWKKVPRFWNSTRQVRQWQKCEISFAHTTVKICLSFSACVFSKVCIPKSTSRW